MLKSINQSISEIAWVAELVSEWINDLFRFVIASFTEGLDLVIAKKHSVVNARAFHFSTMSQIIGTHTFA